MRGLRVPHIIENHLGVEFANCIRILNQYLVIGETATFAFDFKSLWLIDFFR